MPGKTNRMLFNRLLPAPSRPTSITTLDGSDGSDWICGQLQIPRCLVRSKLSFQTHIKPLQSKIKSRIGFLLFCNKASFTHAAKHTLVKRTILPILDFSYVIYKIASNTLLTVPSALSPKPHILPTTATCMLSLAGPHFIFVAKPTGSRSAISLC